MKRIRFLAIAAALSGLAFSAHAAGESTDAAGQQQNKQMQAGQQARQVHTTRDQHDALIIDGQKMSREEVVGLPVLTPDGNRIGEVSKIITRENTYNDVVVKVDEENRQMGITSPDPQKMPGKAQNEPVVVGGDTIALGEESLSRAQDRKALIVDPTALKAGSEWFLEKKE